jgi:hypothetical protein
MATAIHFIGKETSIAALSRFNCDYWALFQNKQLVVTKDQFDELGEWMDMLGESGSSGAYTVRLYNEPGPFDWSTPYVCNFNISLNDRYAGMGITGYNNQLVQRIAALEGKKSEDKEAKKDFGDVVMGWLESPEDLQVIAGIIGQFMGKPAVQAIGNVSPQFTPPAMPIDQQDKLTRLSQVLDRLEKRDPKLLDHLEKLAKLDDLTFSIIIAKLDAL